MGGIDSGFKEAHAFYARTKTDNTKMAGKGPGPTNLGSAILAAA